jgi:hypothetical protein
VLKIYILNSVAAESLLPFWYIGVNKKNPGFGERLKVIVNTERQGLLGSRSCIHPA